MTIHTRPRLLSLLLALLLLTGCDETPTGLGSASEDALELQPAPSEFTLDSRAPAEADTRNLYFTDTPKRRQMGDIAHRQFEVRVGPGPFDIVRIHRVVRERRPYRPVRTRGSVFMVHGSSQNFDDIFFTAGAVEPTPQTSIPLYLAANAIDVWGIDLGWTMVPEAATDFSFMEDWGIERDVDHTLTAMSIARFLRGLTGQGFGRINLLGFSYGAAVAYAAAGQETQQPWFHRDIHGLIPVDFGLKVDDESRRQAACELAAADRERFNAGQVINNNGIVLNTFSNLATSAPDDPSPLISGFTNYQAALFLGVNPAAFWQFVGVDFDSNGFPVDLLYSDPDRWIRLLGSLPPYMPLLSGIEIGEARCDEADVRIDDHLAEIAVPILYLGAGGGFGAEEGESTTRRTASEDVTIFEVSLQPEELRAIDFGHADLFLGENASALAWEMLRGWLEDHDMRGRGRGPRLADGH